jgi:uncharacterized membrane protein
MPQASSNRGLMILLAYLWPLALVPFFVEKNDQDVRWHARHGLVLMAVETAVFTVSWIAIALVTLAAFGLGILLSVAFVFVWVGVLVLHLTAIVKGLNGTRLIVPHVSPLADRL